MEKPIQIKFLELFLLYRRKFYYRIIEVDEAEIEAKERTYEAYLEKRREEMRKREESRK